jgi:hypothetical protein
MIQKPSSVPIALSAIKFEEFDFIVDKSRLFTAEKHDGSLTVRIPGTARKTANYELVFIPFFKKYKVKFKHVAIGRSKNKKIKDGIVVFDQNTLLHQSADIRKYGNVAGFVNSKAHVLKILSIFKIPIPDKENQVLKVYFKLHPTELPGNKLNYRICTIFPVRIINHGHKKDFGRINGKQQNNSKTLNSDKKEEIKPALENIL